MTDTERRIIEKVGELTYQEAKVVLLMRERPFQTLTVIMEHGKVIHKERKEPIKD
jgi:hypothetical protein